MDWTTSQFTNNENDPLNRSSKKLRWNKVVQDQHAQNSLKWHQKQKTLSEDTGESPNEERFSPLLSLDSQEIPDEVFEFPSVSEDSQEIPDEVFEFPSAPPSSPTSLFVYYANRPWQPPPPEISLLPMPMDSSDPAMETLTPAELRQESSTNAYRRGDKRRRSTSQDQTEYSVKAPGVPHVSTFTLTDKKTVPLYRFLPPKTTPPTRGLKRKLGDDSLEYFRRAPKLPHLSTSTFTDKKTVPLYRFLPPKTTPPTRGLKRKLGDDSLEYFRREHKLPHLSTSTLTGKNTVPLNRFLPPKTTPPLVGGGNAFRDYSPEFPRTGTESPPFPQDSPGLPSETIKFQSTSPLRYSDESDPCNRSISVEIASLSKDRIEDANSVTSSPERNRKLEILPFSQSSVPLPYNPDKLPQDFDVLDNIGSSADQSFSFKRTERVPSSEITSGLVSERKDLAPGLRSKRERDSTSGTSTPDRGGEPEVPVLSLHSIKDVIRILRLETYTPDEEISDQDPFQEAGLRKRYRAPMPETGFEQECPAYSLESMLDPRLPLLVSTPIRGDGQEVPAYFQDFIELPSEAGEFLPPLSSSFYTSFTEDIPPFTQDYIELPSEAGEFLPPLSSSFYNSYLEVIPSYPQDILELPSEPDEFLLPSSPSSYNSCQEDTPSTPKSIELQSEVDEFPSSQSSSFYTSFTEDIPPFTQDFVELPSKVGEFLPLLSSSFNTSCTEDIPAFSQDSIELPKKESEFPSL